MCHYMGLRIMLILFTYLLIFEQEIIPVWQNLLMKIHLPNTDPCYELQTERFILTSFLWVLTLVIVYEHNTDISNVSTYLFHLSSNDLWNQFAKFREIFQMIFVWTKIPFTFHLYNCLYFETWFLHFSFMNTIHTPPILYDHI